MKVFDPADASHTLVLIPRFMPSTALTFSLTNEATKVVSTPANTYEIKSGKLKVTFTFTFVDKDRYSIKLEDTSEVVYRGKIIATTQTAQDFKLTDGLYLYE